MQAVLDDPPPDIEARLLAVLEARFARFVRLTSASASAAELYDVQDRLCGDIAREAESRAQKLLERLLRAASTAGEIDLGRSGLPVRQVAAALIACAHAAKGADAAAATPAEYAERLGVLVRLVVRGLVLESD
jgi:hypothetical protein